MSAIKICTSIMQRICEFKKTMREQVHKLAVVLCLATYKYVIQ